MAAHPQPMEALDRVQFEINRVLELTGRVFAASKGSNRGTAIATSARLKQILPAYVNSYHTALDELDQQLHYAKLVMRRDLALLNEESESKLAQAALQNKSSDDAVTKSAVEVEVVEDTGESLERSDLITSEEVAKPDGSDESESKLTASNHPDQAARPDNDEPASQSKDDVIMDDVGAKELDHINTAQQADSSDQQNKSGQAETAPDTAFSTDMDSLFNDPASAGGLISAGANADNTDLDFTNTANSSSDFNFADFNAGLQSNTQGNDDASNLIPGLPAFSEGNGGNDDGDFSALFGPPTTAANESQSKADPNAADPSNEQQDFNFDDMMDFDIISDNKDGNNSAENTGDFDLDFI